MNVLGCFSDNYSEARENFIGAAVAAGAETVSFENPNYGVDGEQLFTDAALLGNSRARSVLVVCSGTHGVEGYCGSGIQTALLRDHVTEGIGDGIRIVMIHALNPYGFSHLRRFNEDNVDLNRNFVEHERPHPSNSAYDDLYDAINPKADSLWSRNAAFLKLLGQRVTQGRKTLKVAITEGQYTHPAGLFYGGRSEVWSNKTFRMIAERYLQGAERVTFVDIHTGLGPFGHGELICRFPSASPTYKRMVGWWGKRATATEQSDAETASLNGTITYAISKMLPGAEVYPTTLEFGTFGPIKVLRALQVENWHHQSGNADHPDFQATKEALKRAFYPDSEDWKNHVWVQGRMIASEALAGLAAAE